MIHQLLFMAIGDTDLLSEVERELSTDGALMIALLYIVCTVCTVAVILIAIFFLSQRCRKKDKQVC